MASGDTALWLHNKLGSTDDLWSGKTICAQLSQQKLQSINHCFHALQPHVKVKLLLSFLHIPRRNVEQWKMELEAILMMAIHDSDQWVTMVGEILRPYPSTGNLNLDLEDNTTFSEILGDLTKAVKKSASVRMLPLECQFLNKTALTATTGPQPQTVKHFALKRKPKSAILRADLLQKSSEVANSKKHNAPNNFPVKIRSFAKKLDDGTASKGFHAGRTPTTPGFRGSPGFGRINNSPISSGGTPLAGHRNTSLRKEGGIKLLDLDALPVGAKEAKRRKKQAEVEEMERQKKEKEAAEVAANAATTENYTPDYAAGLTSTAKISAVIPTGSTNSLTVPTASYAPASATKIPNPPVAPFNTVTTMSSATIQARDNLQQQLQQQLGQPQTRTIIASVPQNNGQAVTLALPTTPVIVNPVNQSNPSVTATQQPVVGAAPAQATQKKGLSLTREQMMEAQEMFRTSNKVTRPEKALILGFMAGSRENPCPQQGHVLSIRLSEDHELVAQPDATQKKMIVDTFFQMNYQTGEWKRIKKSRKCED